MSSFLKATLKYPSYHNDDSNELSIITNNSKLTIIDKMFDKVSNNKRHKKYRRPENKMVDYYNNTVYSEYVSSNVINFLNFNNVKAHEVMLGVDKKNKIYSICFDYRHYGNILRYNACSIEGILNASKSKNKCKSIEDIIDFIKGQNYVDETTLIKYFWSMFMLDALNLNRDRQVDSWGLIYDPLGKSWKPGNMFDNGSSLLAKLNLKEILITSKNKENCYDTIIVKVLHSLKEKSNDLRRLNYREFLSTTDNKECLEVLKEFYEFLNINLLLSYIDSLEIEDNIKDFYKNIYKKSYELIIKYAYENNPNMQK